MSASQQAYPVASPPDALADEEARHRRLAAEATPINNLPAVAYFFTLSIRELETTVWDLSPAIDDEAASASDPQALRRLRRWHAAWVALEQKEREREEHRRRREDAQRRRGLAFAASVAPSPAEIGGAA